MRKETMQGLLVAAGILVAMGGVFAYATTQFGEYPVGWEEVGTVYNMTADGMSASNGAFSGALQEGQSFTFPFNVTTPNMTRVHVTLEWTDDVATGDASTQDEFSVAVQTPVPQDPGPSSQTFPASNTGTINGNVLLNGTLPENTTVPARSPDHGREQMEGFVVPDRVQSADFGNGQWNVTVTLTSAPGTPPPPATDPTAPAQQTDGSNQFTLRFEVHWYRAVVGEERI